MRATATKISKTQAAHKESSNIDHQLQLPFTARKIVPAKQELTIKQATKSPQVNEDISRENDEDYNESFS
jgi:hypothetical protein